MRLPLTTLLALLPFFLEVSAQGSSGTGKTTRYWDCCKPSCGWPKKGNAPSPVGTCDKGDKPLNDGGNTKSGCDNGGSAFMCSNHSPWAVNATHSYGWAAVNVAGSNEASWCCACYELTFTSGPVSGKKLIVQATNTGGDLGNNHFDLAIPGGGVGQFNGTLLFLSSSSPPPPRLLPLPSLSSFFLPALLPLVQCVVAPRVAGERKIS